MSVQRARGTLLSSSVLGQRMYENRNTRRTYATRMPAFMSCEDLLQGLPYPITQEDSLKSRRHALSVYQNVLQLFTPAAARSSTKSCSRPPSPARKVS